MQIAAIHSTSVFVIPSSTLTNNRRTDNFRLASLVPTCLNVQAAQKYVVMYIQLGFVKESCK